MSRRRRLLLWSALPVLLALVLATKLLGAAWFSGQASAAFARADAPAVGTAASVLGFANFLEPHKAPFAAGDALALRGDFAGARTAFEAALAGAPPADECRVQANLALSIERLGGAGLAGPDHGVRLFEEALAVVTAASEDCFGSNSTDHEAGDSLQASAQRLAERIGRLRNQPDASGGTGPAPGTAEQGSSGPAGPMQAQLEQLRESGKSAQLERNHGQQREEYLNGSNAGPLTGKPW
ncbi:hypothetical protein [Arthrobacter sp. PsM3]|uniref:hypothetical protein n=1 Tax=Arthrobacter sp. PsM3 TaxID=3030531 RepID=UPI00263A9498|nr:hypothetical protein [Arthrobacter sp. PsM3]MDN4646332.1 hypothetical protein [Arthrobacter sp. PsM3]